MAGSPDRTEIYGGTAMKWSQAVCASILVDGLCSLPPVTKPQPRLDRDLDGVAVDPASRPNVLAADWRWLPKSGRTQLVEMAILRVARRRPSSFATDA
jgi:hypothetical protein